MNGTALYLKLFGVIASALILGFVVGSLQNASLQKLDIATVLGLFSVTLTGLICTSSIIKNRHE